MSPFHKLVPIEKTPSEVLVRMAREIWPVKTNAKRTKNFIDQWDIVQQGHTMYPQSLVRAKGLNEVERMETLHTMTSRFSASSAEVLLQIRGKVDELKKQGINVVAYEVLGHNGLKKLQVGKKPDPTKDDTVFTATTVLYSGDALPEELKQQPILCRGTKFNAPAND